jgi:hypothetical protein
MFRVHDLVWDGGNAPFLVWIVTPTGYYLHSSQYLTLATRVVVHKYYEIYSDIFTI